MTSDPSGCTDPARHSCHRGKVFHTAVQKEVPPALFPRTRSWGCEILGWTLFLSLTSHALMSSVEERSRKHPAPPINRYLFDHTVPPKASHKFGRRGHCEVPVEVQLPLLSAPLDQVHPRHAGSGKRVVG